jgi:uncharacterized protein (DUF58 family)
LVFVFTVAFLADMNLMMILAGMMVGPLWFSRRLVAATLRGLAIQRKMPHEICAGDMLVVTLDLANTRRRLGSWAVVVEEHIQREGGLVRQRPVHASVLFSYVPAGQARERTYRGRINQRGRYQLGPLKITTRFPFGFFRRTTSIEQSDSVMVFPRLGRLTRQWRARHHESFEGVSRRERQHGGTMGDYYGVRPWRSGDSRRLIHWRSSARHGALMVRQFDRQRNRDLAVLIELWQPEVPTAEQLENVELAVSFAATLVAEACRTGGSDLVIGTTAHAADCLRGPASVALLHDAMETLATAEADHRDHLPTLLDSALKQTDRGTEIVLIGTRPIDLADAARFGALYADPSRRAMLAQVRSVNTADAGLAQYFVVE